jgi:flagellar basal body-associated protein FliL
MKNNKSGKILNVLLGIIAFFAIVVIVFWLISKKLNVGSTENSTSTSTGAINLMGGCGIAKNLYVGEQVYVNGKSITDAFSTSKLSNVYDDNIHNKC